MSETCDTAIDAMHDELHVLDEFVGKQDEGIEPDDLWLLKAALARLHTFFVYLPEGEADRVLSSTDYYCFVEDWLDDLDEVVKALRSEHELEET